MTLLLHRRMPSKVTATSFETRCISYSMHRSPIVSSQTSRRPRCINSLRTQVQKVDECYDKCQSVWTKGEVEGFNTDMLLSPTCRDSMKQIWMIWSCLYLFAWILSVPLFKFSSRSMCMNSCLWIRFHTEAEATIKSSTYVSSPHAMWTGPHRKQESSSHLLALGRPRCSAATGVEMKIRTATLLLMERDWYCHFKLWSVQSKRFNMSMHYWPCTDPWYSFHLHDRCMSVKTWHASMPNLTRSNHRSSQECQEVLH